MAARFRFRLEGLLKVRRSLEEEAQRNLARMLAQEAEAQKRLALLQEDHQTAVEARRISPMQVVDLDRWRAIERYLLVLERRIQTARQEREEAGKRVALARQALLKAHQDHLMLVRLKERRQEQHALETQREETRQMDEMAMLRHGRRSASLS
jgi:flagellar FliJ protein